MKFIAQKSEIYDAVINTGKAASAKSTIPALEGIHFDLNENTLTLTGYDLDLGIKTSFQVDGKDNGAIVINARLVSDLIRKLPDGNICFDVDEKNMVNIKAGEVEFSIMGMQEDDYPSIPVVSPEKSFSMPQALLKEMINQTLFAVAVNEIKPVHTGSKFDIIDGELNVVSVDGVRMAIRKEKVDFEDFSFVVPGKTLSEVSRMLDDDTEKKVTLCVDRNQISFEVEKYTIISRLLEGDFINYANSMSFNSDIVAKVNVREFSDSLERAMLLINEKHKSPVKLEFEPGMLKISCASSLGKVNDSIKIEYSGTPLKIGLNAKYMLDAISHSNSDMVKIMLMSAIKPVKVLPIEGDSFTFLIMPMRIKE